MLKPSCILGAGMTGLAAGISSHLPIYEGNSHPGGICYTYAIEPFRFEIGGGHWIFGVDESLLHFLSKFCTPIRYTRDAGVFIPKEGGIIPYPIQDNLFKFSKSAQILLEMFQGNPQKAETMKEWLYEVFGETLCQEFFSGFNSAYTDGLWDRISPQDKYKNPIDRSRVIQGAFGAPQRGAGYNPSFIYPQNGLALLSRNLATKCQVIYNREVCRIDTKKRVLHFKDSPSIPYEAIISTLPLDKVISFASIKTSGDLPPYTSTLTINIGATKGPFYPSQHWLYIPTKYPYRVGFYNNVSPWFCSGREDLTAIYAECAFLGGSDSEATKEILAQTVAHQLKLWGFIDKVIILSPTWIDTSYTWSWAYHSKGWIQEAITRLAEVGIYQIGRYGRWHFQGIADSIKEGLLTGALLS